MASWREEQRFLKEMKSFHRQRETLLSKGKISPPLRVGALAIHVSAAVTERSDLTPAEQTMAFQEEGERLQEERERSGDYGEVIRYSDSSEHSLRMSFRDRDVSGIVLIGHGCLSTFWLSRGGVYSWSDAARDSKTNLKQQIEQRTCGHVMDNSAPLGAFSVADQRQLFAPVDQYVPDINPDEALFEQRVFSRPNNNPEQIIQLMRGYRRKRRD